MTVFYTGRPAASKELHFSEGDIERERRDDERAEDRQAAEDFDHDRSYAYSNEHGGVD